MNENDRQARIDALMAAPADRLPAHPLADRIMGVLGETAQIVYAVLAGQVAPTDSFAVLAPEMLPKFAATGQPVPTVRDAAMKALVALAEDVQALHDKLLVSEAMEIAVYGPQGGPGMLPGPSAV